MSDRFQRFATGFGAPMLGYRFLRNHSGLWRYTIMPVALNVLITVAVFVLLAAVAIWYIGTVPPWLSDRLEDWGVWAAWVATVGIGILLLLFCLAAAVLSYKLLSGVLCGYFYGILAEHVEAELGIDRSELRSISFLYEIQDTAYRLGMLIAVQLVFLAVSVLPIAGGPLALVGNLYFTWLINGMDYFDIPLALRGWRFAAKREFGLRHREETLGLGAAVFLFGFIPFVGAVLTTTAVVGAVLLHRQLQQTPLPPVRPVAPSSA